MSLDNKEAQGSLSQEQEEATSFPDDPLPETQRRKSPASKVKKKDFNKLSQALRDNLRKRKRQQQNREEDA